MRLNALALFCAVLVLSGCSIPQVLGPTVDRYCSLPEKAREAARKALDTRTEPHRVRIECHADV